MAHKIYTSLSTVSVAGNSSLTGIRAYTVSDQQSYIIDPSDDEVYGRGAEKGKASVTGSVVTDDPTHGVAAGETGTGAFTEKQGATSKTTSIANQVITGVSRSASDRGGKGSTTITWAAYSSDGSTSPVTWPSA